MKVAHLVKVTPDKICGLYNTTWDLANGLRKLGVDSILVETNLGDNPHFPKDNAGVHQTSDRGVPLGFTPVLHESDVIVSHSGYGDEVKAIAQEHDIPIVYCAHGRPRVSYLTEKTGGLPLYSYFYQRNSDPMWAGVVTFWEEHVPYLEGLFTDVPVHFVPATVDTDYWAPIETDYNFHGKAGEKNVIISDPWREDTDPFYCLHAFLLWARQNPGAKLHVYGKPKDVPGAGALMRKIQDEGFLGEVPGEVNSETLRNAYNAADFTLTCNRIATRTRRESTACGCPVIFVDEDLKIHTPITREEARADAVCKYDIKYAAHEMKRVLESALKK